MGAMSHVLKIFKAGEQVDSNGRRYKFSRDDLHVLARIYNPIFHEAPLVIGHPTTNAPAYGWAKALRVEGDILEALVDGVDPEFAEMVNKGRYKKISASFYSPDYPFNPAPGSYYLKHVGFLGAVPPAVKGLGDARFSTPTPGVEFCSGPQCLGRDIIQPASGSALEFCGGIGLVDGHVIEGLKIALPGREACFVENTIDEHKVLGAMIARAAMGRVI